MSEWITYRLPEYEEGFSGLVWGQLPGREPYLRNRKDVELGEPWMPIIAPEPYVKPKKWTVEWNNGLSSWCLYKDGYQLVVLHLNDVNYSESAKQIADIYNKVEGEMK